MKQLNLNYLTVLLSVLMLAFFSSCKDDGGDDPINYTPVLNENFSYVVDGNNIIFTTTIPGNVWFTSDETDYPTVDKTVTVNKPEKGTYTFTCSTLGSGVTLTSAPFDVVITSEDISVYNVEHWINLTGGYGQSKGWVLDVKGKVLPGPLSFLGTSWNFVTEANEGDDAWIWDAGFEWTFAPWPDTRMMIPGEESYGVMYFDLIDGMHFTANKNMDGTADNNAVDENGTYVFDWENRTITLTGATILRSYKPYARVVEGTDTTYVEGMNGISDWANYKIYTLNDSVLRIAVSRDQDVQDEGTCWLIYNFISKEYDDAIVVNEELTYTEPVLTAFTKADLVGTWKYATMPQGWIAYAVSGNMGTEIPAHMFGQWDTREQVVTDLVSWGAANADSIFTANENNTYVFNEDGTCVLNGVANTFSVADGIITFGTALSGDEWSLVWLTMSGTELKAIDVQYYGDPEPVAYTPLGLWIGQNNDGKKEYRGVQLVKQ